MPRIRNRLKIVYYWRIKVRSIATIHVRFIGSLLNDVLRRKVRDGDGALLSGNTGV